MPAYHQYSAIILSEWLIALHANVTSHKGTVIDLNYLTNFFNSSRSCRILPFLSVEIVPTSRENSWRCVTAIEEVDQLTLDQLQYLIVTLYSHATISAVHLRRWLTQMIGWHGKLPNLGVRVMLMSMLKGRTNMTYLVWNEDIRFFVYQKHIDWI